MEYKLYEVGGRVRDKLLGIPSNDVDYSVVIEHHSGWGKDVNVIFGLFVNQIRSEGYKIHVTTPDCFTVRAKFPVNHRHAGLDADFVLARREEGYIEGTRKPNVVLGTLMDDLIRRDFTVNAMAEDMSGKLIDPFDGQADLLMGILRTPLDSSASFNDDPLRVLRAMRFGVTKSFGITNDIVQAIKLLDASRMSIVSTERIMKELSLMFKHDTSLSWRWLRWLEDLNPALFRNILREGMWLMPTNKS